MPKAKQFACKECGQAYNAIAPDDYHQFASLTKGAQSDEIEVKHTCPRGHVNVLYWANPSPVVL